MKHVYVVQHTYEDDDHEDTKFIGVYATEAKAKVAIVKLRVKPGFSLHPDGFYINKYEIDKDHWTEGFGWDETTPLC